MLKGKKKWMSLLKDQLFHVLTKTRYGEQLVFFFKKMAGRLPVVDLSFPLSVSIELSSVCNLSCVHCPSHLPSLSFRAKPHGMMKLSLFYKAMDELDEHGPMALALHKDGEPLLHPDILKILGRVKQGRPHHVTLITNGHFFSEGIQEAVLREGIDEVLFSIGAASTSFYEKIRGEGFDRIVGNIIRFIGEVKRYHPGPQVTVQIVRLPEYWETEYEIREFCRFWGEKGVHVMVYDKLNWGVFESPASRIRRYPCPSLWRTLFVHWDGKISACCIDWDQSLSIGNLKDQTIASAWSGDMLRNQRQLHLNGQFGSLELCRTCNFWSTVSRVDRRELGIGL